jgi:hypothetical protein
MNIRKHLLTALAILSFGAGAMAQGKPEHRHFKEVPKGSKEIVYKDVHYHYAEGKFYSPHDDGYDQVEAPVGIEVDRLPAGYKIKKHKGVTYYYKDDVCFKKGAKKGYYVTVKRPW